MGGPNLKGAMVNEEKIASESWLLYTNPPFLSFGFECPGASQATTMTDRRNVIAISAVIIIRANAEFPCGINAALLFPREGTIAPYHRASSTLGMKLRPQCLLARNRRPPIELVDDVDSVDNARQSVIKGGLGREARAELDQHAAMSRDASPAR